MRKILEGNSALDFTVDFYQDSSEILRWKIQPKECEQPLEEHKMNIERCWVVIGEREYYKYLDLQSARAEATWLAEKYTQTNFYVFELVGKMRCEARKLNWSKAVDIADLINNKTDD